MTLIEVKFSFTKERGEFFSDNRMRQNYDLE